MLSKVDDRSRVELGETDRNGLLKAAENNDHHSQGKAEDLAPVEKDEPTSVGCADQIGTEATEPSENVHADGGKTEALSQGKREERTRIRTDDKRVL